MKSIAATRPKDHIQGVPWLTKEASLKRLERADAEVDVGLNSMQGGMNRIGLAIRRVKEEGSWRGHYTSFEECCEQRWKLKKSYVYGLIKAENIRDLLLMCGDSGVADIAKDASEAQLREFAKIEDSKEMVNVAKKFAKRKKKTGEGFTAKEVAQEVEPNEIETQCIDLCPHCHQPMPKKKRVTSNSIPD